MPGMRNSRLGAHHAKVVRIAVATVERMDHGASQLV